MYIDQIHVQVVDFFFHRESQVELRQHIDSLADGEFVNH